jgi:RNA polymerase sigma factor (sigma-70 family)
MMRATIADVTSNDVDAAPSRSVGADERRLVARLIAGDDLALGQIYDRYSGLVYGLARRITGSIAAAEEIAQEVFVFLWEHPDRFDAERGSLRGYLGAITHRRAVDLIRRDNRRETRESRVARDPGAAEVIDLADRVSARDLADRVRAAVAMLPTDQRLAVELAYFGGCTFRDVAERLGIPEGTAKSRLRLALGKLANVLGPEVSCA